MLTNESSAVVLSEIISNICLHRRFLTNFSAGDDVKFFTSASSRLSGSIVDTERLRQVLRAEIVQNKLCWRQAGDRWEFLSSSLNSQKYFTSPVAAPSSYPRPIVWLLSCFFFWFLITITNSINHTQKEKSWAGDNAYRTTKINRKFSVCRKKKKKKLMKLIRALKANDW